MKSRDEKSRDKKSRDEKLRGKMTEFKWKRTFSVISFTLMAALSAWIVFYNLGTPSIGSGDEGTHVRAAQSIIAGADFWRPEINGRYYLHKPPLKIALSTIFPLLIGESTFSWRVLDALTGLSTAGIVFIFAFWCLNSFFMGLLAVMLLFGCEAYVLSHGIRTAVQDSMLVFFSAAAMLVFYRSYSRERSTGSGRSSLLKAGILFGLLTAGALLTKSIAGLIAPLMVFVFLISGRRQDYNFRRMLPFILSSMAVCFVLCLFYLIPFYLTAPKSVLYMFEHHIAGHVSEGMNTISSSRFFYFKRLFLDGAAVPPLLFGLAVMTAFVSLCTKSDFRIRFLLVWSLLPLVLYSFVSTKYTWYMAPAYPGMALLCAWWIMRMVKLVWSERGKARVFYLAVSLAGGALLIFNLYGVIGAVQKPGKQNPFEKFTDSVLSYNGSDAGEGRVLYLKQKGLDLALNEVPYMNMLKPLTVKVLKLDKAKQKIDDKEISFSISPAVDAYHLMKKRKPQGYFPLQGALNRHDSWLALSFEKVAEPFKSVDKDILADFKDKTGLSAEVTESLPLTHHFEGDFLLKRLGAQGKISLACESGKGRLPAVIKVNSEEQKVLWSLKEDNWEGSFSLISGAMYYNDNSIQIIAADCSELEVKKLKIVLNFSDKNLKRALKNIRVERVRKED